jgi:two-component system, OmpR family, response regulator
MRLLALETEAHAREFLARTLRQAGHEVIEPSSCLEALRMVARIRVELVIVERAAPLRTGLAVVRLLRAAGQAMPILVLSDSTSFNHRTEALCAGADDFLTKPCAPSELLARVDALERGAHSSDEGAGTTLSFADLQLDLTARLATRGSRTIRLSTRETQVLGFMMSHSRLIVTRSMLLERVWKYYFDPAIDVVGAHVRRLHQVIDEDSARPLVHTVGNGEYTLRDLR